MTDELICNGYSLDLTNGIPIPVSYAIADVKDPSKRKKSFSKEVVLPATMNNNAFFAGAFRYTSNDSNVNFDATVKAEVILKKRGVQVLKGVIKLNSVLITDGVPSYKCQVFAESVDIFLLLQTINVNDLNWSAYNHVLNRTNIKSSWTAAIGSGYYYPLIERRPRIGATIWNTTDLVPYVYLREVLLKCFEFVGLTWNSTFLDSTLFKSILFGYGGGEIKSLPPAELNNRKVLIDNGDYDMSITMQGGVVYMTLGNPFDTNNSFSTFTSTETQDIFNQYEVGEITIQAAGNYILDVNFVVDYAITTDNTNNTYEQMELRVLKNGVPLYSITPSSYTPTALSGTLTFDTNASQEIIVASGDIISFYLFAGIVTSFTDYNDPVYYNGQPDFTLDINTNILSATTIHLTCTNSTITDGETVLLTQFLPSMKCSDLMINCIRQFNLYISDPSDLNVCKIEPLSSYYQATTVFEDITQLVDHDKAIVVKPSANEFSKNILFSYKKQSHYDFTQYFSKWSTEYNNLNQSQPSYYAKGEYKIDLTWATIIPYEVSPGILVPRFIKIENNVLKANQGDPIICFRNGSKSGSWTFKDTIGGGQEVLTTYPCVHHFNNWNTPTFDLSFQLTNELFYVATTVTTINCYSTYYFDFINEMSSKAGQIVNLFVYWNEVDIRNLDFSKLIMINGALFRLNEIKEFAADFKVSTEIELIKVLKAKNNNRRTITITASPIGGTGYIGSPPSVGVDVGVVTGGFSGVSQYSKLIKG
jgi:hypothetical protein